MAQERHTSTSEMPPGRLASIGGIVAAGAAMWIFPPVLLVIGLVFAFVAWRKGDPIAKWVALAVCVGALLGQIVNWLPEDFVTS
jgi:hypothetical protein